MAQGHLTGARLLCPTLARPGHPRETDRPSPRRMLATLSGLSCRNAAGLKWRPHSSLPAVIGCRPCRPKRGSLRPPPTPAGCSLLSPSVTSFPTETPTCSEPRCPPPEGRDPVTPSASAQGLVGHRLRHWCTFWEELTHAFKCGGFVYCTWLWLHGCCILTK